MLKLSEQFYLSWDQYSWKLTERIPTKHYKSKRGYAELERWFPTIQMVLVHIFDEQIKSCEGTELADLQKSVELALTSVQEMSKTLQGKLK